MALTIRTLFDEEVVQTRVRELAQRIAADLPPTLLIVCVLKGAFVLTADLMRALGEYGVEPAVEFLRLSSYGNGKESSGEVLILGDVPDKVQDRHILLVDDILDTGRSLEFARSLFLRRGVAAVSTCVLLDKPERRVVPLAADYTGFRIEDLFVVGYGIDYAEQYRHLRWIGAVCDGDKDLDR